jgi:hypothetical protein
VLPLGAGGLFGTLASRIHNPRFAAVLKECGPDFPRGAGFGHPFSKTAIKVLAAYVACVAKNGYRLPTPNTSGKGPVFPAGTDRILKYRAAARNCVSIVQSGPAPPPVRADPNSTVGPRARRALPGGSPPMPTSADPRQLSD